NPMHLGTASGFADLGPALLWRAQSRRAVASMAELWQPWPVVILAGGMTTRRVAEGVRRVDEFATLRQAEGWSRYPSRDESMHDWIENSQAPVSLAWADGIAKASMRTSQKGEDGSTRIRP